MLLLGACIEPSQPTAFASLVNDGMEENGPFLLGVELDDVVGRNSAEHFSVSTQAVSAAGQPVTISLTGAALLDGRNLEGAVVTGGSTQLRVHVVERTSIATKVKLERVDGGGAGPCGTGTAVALTGVFTRAGLHLPLPGRLTFACVGVGAAAKCIDYGLPPGTSPGPVWDQHQACTRMLRADTCSDGVSHTRAGTRLSFFDTIPDNELPDAITDLTVDQLAQWPPDPSHYFFEAIWRAGSSGAACLSKVRWQSLEPGALCGGTLPDPRVDVAQACEATSIADAISNGGAVLFSKTQYSDLALGLWRATLPNGQLDYVTTVRGYDGGRRLPTVMPFQDGSPVVPYAYVRLDAMLMRALPTTVSPAEVAEVVTFKDTATGARVLTRRDDPRFARAGYVVDAEEGYVLLAPRPGAAAPLVLYRNPGTGDYVSSAIGPPTPAYQPATPNAVIGYLTALEPRW